MAEEKRRTDVVEAGRKGGQVTRERHGSRHYAAIAQKGVERRRELIARGKAAEEREDLQ